MPSTDSSTFLIQIAAFFGATGVGLGAIGAHALKKTLVARGTLESWHTATNYQLLHAVALLGLAAHGDKISPTAGKLLAVGTTLFSGSIYGLSLGIGPKAILGPTTPIGGMLMIGGWAMVGLTLDTTSSKDD